MVYSIDQDECSGSLLGWPIVYWAGGYKLKVCSQGKSLAYVHRYMHTHTYIHAYMHACI